jgi:hypothetical protein
VPLSCRYAKYRYAERCSAECRYAECRYAEFSGSNGTNTTFGKTPDKPLASVETQLVI